MKISQPPANAGDAPRHGEQRASRRGPEVTNWSYYETNFRFLIKQACSCVRWTDTECPPLRPAPLSRRYSAATGEQRALSMHTDGSIFSFNLLLNSPDDFDGGGTFFEDGGDLYAEMPGWGRIRSVRGRLGKYFSF